MLSRLYLSKIFKGYLPQMSFISFLNACYIFCCELSKYSYPNLAEPRIWWSSWECLSTARISDKPD